MEIVDGQLHEPGMSRSWASTPIETQHAALDEVMEAQLRAVGVGGALLHPIEDSGWAHALAAREPDRFAVVRFVASPNPALRRWDVIDPDAPDLPAQLVAASECPGFVAFRVAAPAAADVRAPVDQGNGAVLHLCAERSIPLLSPFAGSPALAGELARAFPTVPFVLDQLALGAVPGGDADPWARLPGVLALAGSANVHLKLTGLPSLSRSPYPYPDLRDPLRAVLDAFGAERCFWASDLSFHQGQIGWGNRFPAMIADHPGKHTYAESVAFLRDATWITDDEREWLLGATVRRLFAWPRRREA